MILHTFSEQSELMVTSKLLSGTKEFAVEPDSLPNHLVFAESVIANHLYAVKKAASEGRGRMLVIFLEGSYLAGFYGASRNASTRTQNKQ